MNTRWREILPIIGLILQIYLLIVVGAITVSILFSANPLLRDIQASRLVVRWLLDTVGANASLGLLVILWYTLFGGLVFLFGRFSVRRLMQQLQARWGLGYYIFIDAPMLCAFLSMFGSILIIGYGISLQANRYWAMGAAAVAFVPLLVWLQTKEKKKVNKQL